MSQETESTLCSTEQWDSSRLRNREQQSVVLGKRQHKTLSEEEEEYPAYQKNLLNKRVRVKSESEGSDYGEEKKAAKRQKASMEAKAAQKELRRKKREAMSQRRKEQIERERNRNLEFLQKRHSMAMAKFATEVHEEIINDDDTDSMADFFRRGKVKEITSPMLKKKEKRNSSDSEKESQDEEAKKARERKMKVPVFRNVKVKDGVLIPYLQSINLKPQKKKKPETFADIYSDPENIYEPNLYSEDLPKEVEGILAHLGFIPKMKTHLWNEWQVSQGWVRWIESCMMQYPTENARDHNRRIEFLRENNNAKQFWSIPLSIDILDGEAMQKVANAQMKCGGRLFDVIMADPPWQLATANPTRGVTISYDCMRDEEIMSIPFHRLQKDGYLFLWVINSKVRVGLAILERFGYRQIDMITWVKQLPSGAIARSQGYYLQHCQEVCLVGLKGDMRDRTNYSIRSDIIFSQRKGQSQKPEEAYEYVESLVPNGFYIELFGRRNNIRDGWVTLGNEI